MAGIAISQLTENGLFEKVKLAKQKSEKSQNEEIAILGDYENKLDSYLSNTRESLNLTFHSESRESCEIPKGIKEAYVIFSHSTSSDPFNTIITGNIIVSSERVIKMSKVDNYGTYLRTTLEIYKVELSGEQGAIKMNVSGGYGTYRAWTACVAY